MHTSRTTRQSHARPQRAQRSKHAPVRSRTPSAATTAAHHNKFSLSHVQSRRFFGKNNTNEQKRSSSDDESDKKKEQSDAEQGQDVEEDPISQLQKKVTSQSNEIEQLQRRLNDNELIIEEWKNKTRQLQDRVKLEIDEQNNIHERYRREIGDVKKYSVGKFAKTLLDGVDALEAAAKATDAVLQTSQDENFKKLAEGLSMTTAVFHKALGKEGITKYQSIGQTVDPNLHFVTAQLPHPSAPAGTITHIIKEGYNIHDRVLRPAQVCVASAQNGV